MSLFLVLVLYTVNQLWVKPMTAELTDFSRVEVQWFVHGYVNDILAGIWLPALINALASLFWVQRALVTDPAKIVLITVMAGLFWELAAPLFVEGSTQDPLDILAYVTGSLLYIAMVRVVQRRAGRL